MGFTFKFLIIDWHCGQFQMGAELMKVIYLLLGIIFLAGCHPKKAEQIEPPKPSNAAQFKEELGVIIKSIRLYSEIESKSQLRSNNGGARTTNQKIKRSLVRYFCTTGWIIRKCCNVSTATERDVEMKV